MRIIITVSLYSEKAYLKVYLTMSIMKTYSSVMYSSVNMYCSTWSS